jgi:hypothetical protein
MEADPKRNEGLAEVLIVEDEGGSRSAEWIENPRPLFPRVSWAGYQAGRYRSSAGIPQAGRSDQSNERPHPLRTKGASSATDSGSLTARPPARLHQKRECRGTLNLLRAPQGRPTSNTAPIFGWFKAATARASSSNRCRREASAAT